MFPLALRSASSEARITHGLLRLELAAVPKGITAEHLSCDIDRPQNGREASTHAGFKPPARKLTVLPNPTSRIIPKHRIEAMAEMMTTAGFGMWLTVHLLTEEEVHRPKNVLDSISRRVRRDTGEAFDYFAVVVYEAGLPHLHLIGSPRPGTPKWASVMGWCAERRRHPDYAPRAVHAGRVKPEKGGVPGLVSYMHCHRNLGGHPGRPFISAGVRQLGQAKKTRINIDDQAVIDIDPAVAAEARSLISVMEIKIEKAEKKAVEQPLDPAAPSPAAASRQAIPRPSGAVSRPCPAPGRPLDPDLPPRHRQPPLARLLRPP